MQMTTKDDLPVLSAQDDLTVISDLSDIVTPKQLALENSELLTEKQLEWMLKTRHKNGLAESGAVLKVSEKLYILRPRFRWWFLKQQA